MNTHDIELPPLPEWADRTLQGDWREEIISWAEHAIEADRQRRGEPVAWVTADTVNGQTVNGNPRRVWWENKDGVGMPIYTAPQPADPAVKESLTVAEPVNEEELLAAREALIDMGYLWDGDQWVEVDPPSETVEQAPEWPDFARMEASLQRLKERLVFEDGRRKDLEQRLREKRNG